jgi:K+-transporting ATPase ATPase B chain
METMSASFVNRRMLLDAIGFSFRRMTPKYQARNPVMFVVFVGSIITTALFFNGFGQAGGEPAWFIGWVAFWLWFTVLFANFAEAIAEGKGRAQAETLKKSRRDVTAKKLPDVKNRDVFELTSAQALRRGDIILVEAGDFVPGDGQVIEGIASVDESAITGESAPVIRESGGDRDAVTGGTRVLSDWVVVRVTANPGESFLDKMIGLVEGAKRQKTPNEIALSILLAAMTIIFLMVCATLLPFSLYSVEKAGQGAPVSMTVLIALLVCLAPTTIGGLLSAIGIAGMNRLVQANVIATSGRAVEAAGDVNVLLLDKTGTITYGNRQAVTFFPAHGITAERMAETAELSSLADETPEGKSIVALARNKYGVKEKNWDDLGGVFIPFMAETRVSGVDLGKRGAILKGAGDAIAAIVGKLGGEVPVDVERQVEVIARQGGTPLIVADGMEVLGVIHLKDVVKSGIKERLAELRQMGIKSVMVTGDNPLTAGAIATEAGVDDFIAQATPETKLKYIRKMQEGGELVAMVGDGTNDAPALAQADVAVSMNTGTQAAKEAGNMVDLDSDPTKLIEIVEIGKQLLMTRGALTTFSIANDLAKFFAIIPAAFVSTYPMMMSLNVMGLTSPLSAILSAVIFNALVIIFLVPLALKGVKYRPVGAPALLRRNIVVYGIGGVIVPFAGIKIIDVLLTMMGVA